MRAPFSLLGTFQCCLLWLVWAVVGPVSAEMPCSDPMAVCANCTLPFQCLADPCRGAICRSSPSATCMVDNCAGCEARFVDRAGSDITSTCNDFLPCSRRGGWDLGIACGRLQEDLCPESSYCDVDPFGRFATCCCQDSLLCGSNPCDSQRCPAYPDAVCQRRCGSCNVMFVTSGGKDVTSMCDTPREACSRSGGMQLGTNCWGGSHLCSPGSYCDHDSFSGFAECCCNDSVATCPGCKLPCSTDLCNTTTCPQYPSAECRVEPCAKNCKARFYLPNREITEECCNDRQHVYQSGICYDRRCLRDYYYRPTKCEKLGGSCHSSYRSKECILE